MTSFSLSNTISQVIKREKEFILITQITCPLAISSGASAVGVGSVINKLDNLVGMIAVIRGLKESLKKTIITEKIS